MTVPNSGQRPRPVRGATFNRAVLEDVGGVNRLKVFALVAAYADAGQLRPTVRELAAVTKLDPRKVIGLLDRLVADGHLERSSATKRTPRYRVVLSEVGDER